MVKGIAIDPIRKILTYLDNHDPVAVEMDEVMTGKKCWKVMNPGHQGEGLIRGSILDYMVFNLLKDDFKFKNSWTKMESKHFTNNFTELYVSYTAICIHIHITLV